jgi:hypothetical protein
MPKVPGANSATIPLDYSTHASVVHATGNIPKKSGDLIAGNPSGLDSNLKTSAHTRYSQAAVAQINEFAQRVNYAARLLAAK